MSLPPTGIQYHICRISPFHSTAPASSRRLIWFGHTIRYQSSQKTSPRRLSLPHSDPSSFYACHLVFATLRKPSNVLSIRSFAVYPTVTHTLMTCWSPATPLSSITSICARFCSALASTVLSSIPQSANVASQSWISWVIESVHRAFSHYRRESKL